MKPILHPQLINDPFGDPGLYVEFLFERRALLCDMGDVGALAPRKLLRISHVFISHTHMDHFIGFDTLLRICLGRDMHIHVYGPAGFLDQLQHKLGAYTWNLVENYATDFTVTAVEVDTPERGRAATFRCRGAFRREHEHEVTFSDGILLDEPQCRVRTTVLDHRIPCLAFAIEEKTHINIWKNRLDDMNLPTGPWLRELKEALWRNEPDEQPFRIWWREHDTVHERHVPLGQLKDAFVQFTPGQKIAYIVDVIYHEDNARKIADLAGGADLLYIESPFLDEDAGLAARKYHLTARQAGQLARRAGVKRVIPFHFSPRHADQAQRLADQVQQAFHHG